MMDSEQDTYLTVTEAATEMGTDERTLYDAIVDGMLDARHEDGRWVISRAALDEYRDQVMTCKNVGTDGRSGVSTADSGRKTVTAPATKPPFFPNAYSKTRLFPGLTFIEALERVVDQSGLTVPNRGEPLAPSPRRSPTAPGDRSTTGVPTSRPWIAPAADAAVAAFQRPRTLEAAKARGIVSRWGLRCVAERLRFGVIDETVVLPLPAREKLFGRLVLPTLNQHGTAIGLSGRYVSVRSGAALRAQHILAYGRVPDVLPAPYNYTGLARARKDGVVIVTANEIDAATILAALDPSGQANIPVIGLSHDTLPSHWAAMVARTEALIILTMDTEATDAARAMHLSDELKTAGCHLAPSFVPPRGCHSLNEALCALGAASLAMALCEHLDEVTHAIRKAQGWRRWACRIA